MKVSRRRFLGSAVAAGFAGFAPPRVVLALGSRPSGRWFGDVPAVDLDGKDITLEASALRELGESLRGALLLEGDFGYDGSRSVWNAMHDRYPALVVRAADSEDVSHAVTFARERRLLLSVKGGGHSWPGRSVANGAMMIDLGALRGVEVDVARRRARVGGGSLLIDIDLATQRHGLAMTAGVVSHTGAGGYTLGGGYGRLARKCGLAIDCLRAAKMVTADGKVRHVSADENKDLFWAIRGGGGNFGVVTEFEYALHEVGPMVLGLNLAWPLDQAPDVLAAYAEHSADLPDDMDLAPGMSVAPDGTGIVTLGGTWFGEFGRAEKELAPFLAVGSPVTKQIDPAPYISLQTQADGAFRPGVRSYVKSGMVKDFSQDLVDAMVEVFDPRRMVMIGSHSAGGAVARVGETETAWPHRNATTLIGAFTIWTDPAQDEEHVAANKDVWSALAPHMGGYYENIQAESSGVPKNFGPVYDRLVAVKSAHDPKNLFRLNSNIKPKA